MPLNYRSALAAFDREAVVEGLAVRDGNRRFAVEAGTPLARVEPVRIAGRHARPVRISLAMIPAGGVTLPTERRAPAEVGSVLGATARPVAFGPHNAPIPAAAASSAAANE